MKIGIIGLQHLGCVTAACLAHLGFDVIAYDNPLDTDTIKKILAVEPGLNELAQPSFTNNLLDLAVCDIAWITFDVPVNDNDIADVNSVFQNIEKIFPILTPHTLIIISTQLPVGSIKKIQAYSKENFPNKHFRFACIPENLRLGQAIKSFCYPQRIVIGIENAEDKTQLLEVVSRINSKIIWMSIAAAEMTKHALNAFFANSIVFINELAQLCEKLGIDAREIEQGLKSEERIGEKAYLKPGAAIGGGTLLRDVNYLNELATAHQIHTPLLSAIPKSNSNHQHWAVHILKQTFPSMENKIIALLGLTYKAETITLQQSPAIQLAQLFKKNGATVYAYDPNMPMLPNSFTADIELKTSLEDLLLAIDALIIINNYSNLPFTPDKLLAHVSQPFVLDPNGYLPDTFKHDKRIKYLTVGTNQCN